MIAKDALLSRTFVQLADTLVDDFDVIDLLTLLTDRCLELLGAAAVGILLVDHLGVLHVTAATSDEIRLLELFQLEHRQEPRLDFFTSKEQVANLTWRRNGPDSPCGPGLRLPEARPADAAAHATIIGTLNIRGRAGHRQRGRPAIAQAMADARPSPCSGPGGPTGPDDLVPAAEGPQQPYRHRGQGRPGRTGPRSGMDEAFSRLRRYARDHNRQLSWWRPT
jgi:hypothetical protein